MAETETALLKRFTGGIVAAVKARAVAVTTIVILGGGSVITYQQVVKPPADAPERNLQPSGAEIFGGMARVGPLDPPDDPNDPRTSGKP